jgi:C1A family cysteine protease
MPKSYGWLPDPRFVTTLDGHTTDLREKDKKFSEFRSLLKSKLKVGPPSPVDLSKFCVVMDQGALPSCVGNGTCESLEILENIANQVVSGYQPMLLSRMFVWTMARTQEGNLSQVTGTHIRTAFNVIATLGVCTENTWPYQDNLSTVSPSLMAQREAIGHCIQGAYLIETVMQDRLNDIITALQANHPVVFGTNVTNAFESLSGNGPVDVPSATDPIAGGHCMVIVGWDGTNFLVKNSWGTGWGANGFCLMTPAYLTWDNTTDLWVPTLGPTF